jgi:hypothetical protein
MMWLVIAWALDRAQLKIGAGTYGSSYCGIGCVDGVNQRTAQAPMVYRVLVPWLIWLGERIAPAAKRDRLALLYEPLKITLMALALWATSEALGERSALLLAALLPLTFYFDYWDWAGEVAGLALALTGQWQMAMAGGCVAVLSRPETSPLVAVTYTLVTQDWLGGALIGAATAALWGVIRWRQGSHVLYRERVMWRVNLADVRGLLRNRPAYLGEISMSLGLTALTLLAVVSGRAGWTFPVPLALLGSGWLLARAAETRVFTSCLLWVVMLWR